MYSSVIGVEIGEVEVCEVEVVAADCVVLVDNFLTFFAGDCFFVGEKKIGMERQINLL